MTTPEKTVEQNLREQLESMLSGFNAPCLLPRQKRTLWTKPYMVSPALVKKRFGKGDLLIGLMAIMHRPHYYLVWIDSEWFENHMCEHIDYIWSAMEDEFGYRDLDDVAPYRWPDIDDSGGSCWFKAGLDDVLTPRARRKLRGLQ